MTAAHRRARTAAILSRVAEGDSDKQIAEALHYSPHTIKCYLKLLYRDLGAANRTHAVVLALRQGLIPMFPEGETENG